MRAFSVILGAMANSKRLEILECLLDREHRVNELAECVNLSQSALSLHLAKLRVAVLVSSRREGQTVFYSIEWPAVRAVLDALEDASGSLSAPEATRDIRKY